jgi:hypothetical protein
MPAPARSLTTGATVGAVMALKGGTECLQQPRAIDRLTAALQRLRQQLRAQERHAPEGFFGLATPSANLPVTANSPPSKALKPKGAQPGHPGTGRQAFDAPQAERVVDLTPLVGTRCPDGATLLEDQGTTGPPAQKSLW